MHLTQRHLDIMGLLYSHQPASPTAAKQFDIHKLWETWTEKDNFAHILNRIVMWKHSNRKKKNLLSL